MLKKIVREIGQSKQGKREHSSGGVAGAAGMLRPTQILVPDAVVMLPARGCVRRHLQCVASAGCLCGLWF
jgi:hypothetical protein